MRGLNRSLWLGMAMLAALTAPVAAAATCAGDCGSDGQVSFDELIVGVEIALGSQSASACGGTGSEVSVTDLVVSVNDATSSCAPSLSTPTPTATPTATQTPPPCDSGGSANLTASSAVPASGAGRLQVSCVTVENAGGTRTDLTRVSARGTVNGAEQLLQVYFVTATGEIDTISYGWIPFPGIPDFYENLTFCNTPGCLGATVNLGTKVIRLRDTSLAGEAASAVLVGTITLNKIPQPEATPTPSCPGGSANLVFSEVQGTNTSQALPATLTLGMAMNFSRNADPPAIAYLSALYDGCPMPFPRFTLGFQFSGATVQAGTTYQVGSIAGQLNQIELREEGFSNFKSWEARDGSLVVDNVTNGRVTFRILDAHMRPKDAGTSGTFVLNTTGALDAGL